MRRETADSSDARRVFAKVFPFLDASLTKGVRPTAMMKVEREIDLLDFQTVVQ
jgi:hypothetical protein